MKIKRLPTTDCDFSLYDPDEYTCTYVEIAISDIDDNTDKLLGEKVNCIFRNKDIEKLNNNETEGTTLAVLCDTCYIKSGIEELKGLDAGQIIPIKFEGEYCPTVPVEWITAKFWDL